MTVSAEDTFEVSIVITVKNNKTGEMVTETKHTDASLNYGAMQLFRETVIRAINDETGKLGGALAESFGQGGAKAMLSNMMNRVTDKVLGTESQPGVIR